MGLLFDGINSYVDVGNVLNATTSMTVCCWVRRDSSGSRLEIISKEDNVNGWEMSISPTGIVEFGVFNGSYPTAVGTTSLNIGTIYFICGVRTSTSNLIKIYINGIFEGSTSAGSSPAPSSVNLNIGRRPNNTRYFNGFIEDVRVYDRDLNDDEILHIYYSKGKDKIFNNLVGRWITSEQPPGTKSVEGYSIQNIQTFHQYHFSGATTLTLPYTVPSGIVSSVLVVCCGSEEDVVANCEPLSATFNGNSMTKRAGTRTTSGYGAGSAIFTTSVTSGQSGNIIVTYNGLTDGKILHAFIVIGATHSINVSTSSFNNNGSTTTRFITTINNLLGIIHQFTGNENFTITTNGIDHIQLAESSKGTGTSGYSSRCGYFNATSSGNYSGYGYNLSGSINRQAMTMVALVVPPPTIIYLSDYSLNSYNGILNGNTQFTEMLAITP